jgi:hypothetical protein
MDHVHFSQSREGVTEIRTACGIRVGLDACTLLNRPSILGYSNTQPFSYSRPTFASAEGIGERHFPFRLSAFSAPRTSHQYELGTDCARLC